MLIKKRRKEARRRKKPAGLFLYVCEREVIVTDMKKTKKKLPAVGVIAALLAASMMILSACGSTVQEGAQDTRQETRQASDGGTAETAGNTTESSAAGGKVAAGETAMSGGETVQPTEEDSMTDQEMTEMKMKIGDTQVAVEWADNEAVEALRELVKEEPLTIQMSMYGGFEQVGPIGQRLPASDSQTTTQSGDIVLYTGSQIVVFYGSNSWAYTRLGHITDQSAEDMKNLLGNGDVTITIGLEDEVKRVARDGADMQTEDKSMPTRVPMEGGTKINMYFGDTVIPGVLNDSETAKALIEKLPITQHVSRYSHDFCGVTEDLPYKEEDVHYGWLNGDIDYATDAPYFTILFEDEDDSEQYGYQVNIGVITCPLSEIAELEGSFDVRIELAEE